MAKVFNKYYGTPKRHVMKLLKQGKHVLLCIDVKGARHVRQEFPTTVAIFIKTPSMKVLQQRLRQRASETEDSLGLRLEVARRELKEARHYDHVVINAVWESIPELGAHCLRGITERRRSSS